MESLYDFVLRASVQDTPPTLDHFLLECTPLPGIQFLTNCRSESLRTYWKTVVSGLLDLVEYLDPKGRWRTQFEALLVQQLPLNGVCEICDPTKVQYLLELQLGTDQNRMYVDYLLGIESDPLVVAYATALKESILSNFPSSGREVPDLSGLLDLFFYQTLQIETEGVPNILEGPFRFLTV